MSEKWIAGVIAAFLVSIALSAGFESYTKQQCRTEAMKTNRTAEDIHKICR